MKKLLIPIALLAILSACSSWHNDNYPDPAVAKSEFKKDRQECEKRTTERLQIGVKESDRTLRRTRDNVNFSANYNRAKEFDNCMKARGWVER